jgi:hypothetical protein
MARCHAKSKQSGEQCKNCCVKGYTVCRFHGAGGGRKPINFRYSYSLEKNPILKKNFDLIIAEGADDFDVTPEIVLMRARLASAVEEGTVDIKVLNEIHRDLIKAVQKNTELQIKRQGLIQRSDADKILKAAVKVIVGYVPASVKAACFEELGRVLSGSLLQDESVIAGELAETNEQTED